MKRLLILIFFSFPAIAEWKPLMIVKKWSYDPQSVNIIDESKVRVYLLRNFDNHHASGSVETHIEYDCRDKSYRELSMVFYKDFDLKGERIVDSEVDTSVKYYPRDTNGYAAMVEVCVNVFAPEKVKEVFAD